MADAIRWRTALLSRQRLVFANLRVLPRRAISLAMPPSSKPSGLIQRDRSVLVVVDLQERLAPAIQDVEPVLANAERLMRAAKHFSLPVLATEQYPAGLGHSVPRLHDALASAQVLEKTSFGALGESEIAARFEELAKAGRDEFLLLGTETHVCVLQTGMQILSRGWRLLVIEDACGSRRANDKALGMARMAEAGAERVTTEMVLFEWLGRAATDDFRALLPLIRDG